MRSRIASPLTVLIVALPSTSPRTMRSPDAVLVSSSRIRPRIFVSADAFATSTAAPCGTRALTRSRPPDPKLKSPIWIVMPSGFLPRSSTTIRLPSCRISVSSIIFSLPSTTMCVSSPSTVSMSMSPTGTLTSSAAASGVWKVCSMSSAISDRADDRGAERAANGLGEPLGRREAFARGGELDRASKRLGQADHERPLGDAGRVVVDPMRGARCGLLVEEHLLPPLAPAVAGQTAAAPTAPAGGRARLAGAGDHLDEPRVDRHSLACGGGLQAGLEALRQAQRDPGGERFVGRLGRCRFLVPDVDELRVAARKADLD